MESERRLRQAIQAIQSGDKELGKHLLAVALRHDPRNVQAWLWLSGVVDSAEQQRECLRRMLTIDPRHQLAQTGLTYLTAGQVRTIGEPRPLAPPSLTGPSPGQRAAPAVPARVLPTGGPLSTSQDRESAGSGPPPEPLESTQRRISYRNVMLVGALTLALICGLVMLFITVVTVVPQAQDRLRPTPEPVLYTATLWCLPCEQAGSPIILWEKVGDGITRGAKVGELPHDTTVDVVGEEWSAAENRSYLKVAAQGQKGWVPQTFVKR